LIQLVRGFPTSPSNAGSRNPPPPLSPLLIHQLCTVPKITADDERLGDDAMGVKGSRASRAGVLAGGVGFVSCVLLCASLLMLLLRAPPPVDSVVMVLREPMEALNQLDGAVGDFILPISPTSPRNAGSHNPPPALSPLLIHQLRTVPKMAADDERLGDDAMGVQGSRASLAGVLAGGVGFVSCVLLCASLLMLLLCCILLLLVDLTQVL